MESDAADVTTAETPELQYAMADEETSGLAWPWRRYWARMVDVLVGILIVSFVVGILRPSLFEPGGLFYGTAGDRIFTILLLPFALVVDAIICRVCGNTAGKAIAGIRTVHDNGRTMSFVETLKRNLRLWVSGLGLGIPIVSLVTLVRSHGKGRAGRPCAWEDASGVRSFAGSDSIVRTTLVAVLFLGLSFCLLALGQLEG